MATSVGVCKAAIIILGVAVLAIGLYSHFQSAWVKTVIKIIGIGELKPYQVCEIQVKDNKCPHIALERLYIATILITFLISLFGLILSLLCGMNSKPIKILDVTYHVVAAIVLLVAAALYILSAEQINEVMHIIDDTMNFRRTEKLIAGGLTAVQGLLYGITAIIIIRS